MGQNSGRAEVSESEISLCDPEYEIELPVNSTMAQNYNSIKNIVMLS
jgi:hypothetical protein